ncbi:MAG: hypothetical protein ACRDG7_11565 [Candidatus Limnocylindria bacterium]
MGNRKSNHSGRIVRAAAVWLAGAGGCWLLAFGVGYGGEIPGWVVAVPVLVGAGVAGFLWFASKFAHGGDWVCESDDVQARGLAEDLVEVRQG